MGAAEHLLIFGASARAAAHAALRADLRPWCADLFADADLVSCCPTRQVARECYPADFLRLSREGPPGPWMYTGGLENRPRLVRAIARERPLWGNDAAVLRKARSPFYVAELLRGEGVPCPRVYRPADRLPSEAAWLVKPLAGAGGMGICRLRDDTTRLTGMRGKYLQEYIVGEPCAATYLGDGRQSWLLGVTKQFVGEPWLHAVPFHYCGSVGPLELSAALRQALAQLGAVLVRGCGLRGLFGVDFIVRDGVPWPVEVNPRYTASVEVLEHAANLPAMASHRSVFDRDAPVVPPVAKSDSGVVGKAILFARETLVFPSEGPWQEVLRAPGDAEALPAFADVPRAGETIPAGRPVLTFFARAGSVAACVAALRAAAAGLDRLLFRS